MGQVSELAVVSDAGGEARHAAREDARAPREQKIPTNAFVLCGD